MAELSSVEQEKLNKAIALKEQGFSYPNAWLKERNAGQCHRDYGEHSRELLEQQNITLSYAGRIMLKRVMGKASFAHVHDDTGALQIYIASKAVGEASYREFENLDLGDIVGVAGVLFKTQTGELSLRVLSWQLLTKSVAVLPDKFHGLHDAELCQRQRYLDLMVNPETRQRFKMRSNIISQLRQFFLQRDYLEVETPMMHVIPGGATARPFTTHHNALDMTLYLRIAPELYLKRLLVGGYERVFELNRNFRNEGISPRHNPEFTMLEFYQAYQTHHDFMALTEELLKELSLRVCGHSTLEYQGQNIELGKSFAKLDMCEALLHYCPGYQLAQLTDRDFLAQELKKLKLEVKAEDDDLALQNKLFEHRVESLLQQPTFIINHAAAISPLARKNDNNPAITDRFELYIAGRELANGFSELNDPFDQAQRFEHQLSLKQAGDDEAMFFDHDYIRALQYGMPPAAGEGIGVDRLVMLLTNSTNIRDVILFPHMRALDSSL